MLNPNQSEPTLKSWHRARVLALCGVLVLFFFRDLTHAATLFPARLRSVDESLDGTKLRETSEIDACGLLCRRRTGSSTEEWLELRGVKFVQLLNIDHSGMAFRPVLHS